MLSKKGLKKCGCQSKHTELGKYQNNANFSLALIKHYLLAQECNSLVWIHLTQKNLHVNNESYNGFSKAFMQQW